MNTVLEYVVSRPFAGDTSSQNQEAFRQCFQRSLSSCLRRGFSVEECFGVVWEETLDEIPSVIPDLMIFLAETVVVTWIVFFSLRLIGAPGRVWWREVKEKERLIAVLALSFTLKSRRRLGAVARNAASTIPRATLSAIRGEGRCISGLQRQ